jgi:hypothetical protein
MDHRLTNLEKKVEIIYSVVNKDMISVEDRNEIENYCPKKHEDLFSKGLIRIIKKQYGSPSTRDLKEHFTPR